jgi:hypothetical protein
MIKGEIMLLFYIFIWFIIGVLGGAFIWFAFDEYLEVIRLVEENLNKKEKTK